MSELDPDWPGNWEDEDEPRTREIPDSMDAVTLFEKIDLDPERVKFQQFTPMVIMYLLIAGLSLFAGFLVFVLLEPLISFFLFSLGFVFIFIVNHDGNSHRTVASSLGIGGRPPFSSSTAIEWKHVEHIDVIPNGGKPSEFVFRGNDRYLWHDNHALGKKMTLEFIAEYIPDFASWTSRQKIGWKEGVLVYSRPGSEGVGLVAEEGRRQVDEFDEFKGHFATKEIIGSLGSEELLAKIKNDPECVRNGRWGNAGSAFAISLAFTLIFLIPLHAFALIDGLLVVLPAYIIIGLVWIGIIYWLVREVRKHGFYLSPLGIGAVEAFTEPQAIRWDHIEWIDVWIKDDRLHLVGFAGNQREIRIRNFFFHKRFELEDIARYLPDYLSWKTSRHEDWIDGITRYRRNLDI